MIYESQFLLSLFLTLSIEIPVLFILLKHYFDRENKITTKNIVVTGIIASTLSLPYFWFILPPYIDARYYLFGGEVIVIIIEAAILSHLLNLNAKDSIIVSSIMNIASFCVGLLIFYK